MLTGIRKREQGATALIVVLFSTLLFVVVSVGFMSMMTAEQRSSFDNELSQGAYDAALAGVEDGKRALQACTSGSGQACNAIDNSPTKCDLPRAAGVVSNAGANNETFIKSVTAAGSDGSDYNQAYTCVRLSRSTDNYMGSLVKDGTAVVPLRVAPGKSFSQVMVQWFMRTNSTSDSVTMPITPAEKLPVAGQWPVTAPPLLRAQLIQAKAPITLSSMDNDGGGHTVYLFPQSAGATKLSFSGVDARRTGKLTPKSVICAPSFMANGGYACSATLELPPPPGSGDVADPGHIAYLRLSSIYNGTLGTEFKITLQDSAGSAVQFDNVQPSIDSTGRAADVYRRVEARVEQTDPNDQMLYPRATVDISGNFCKYFSITDDRNDFADECEGF